MKEALEREVIRRNVGRAPLEVEPLRSKYIHTMDPLCTQPKCGFIADSPSWLAAYMSHQGRGTRRCHYTKVSTHQGANTPRCPQTKVPKHHVEGLSALWWQALGVWHHSFHRCTLLQRNGPCCCGAGLVHAREGLPWRPAAMAPLPRAGRVTFLPQCRCQGTANMKARKAQGCSTQASERETDQRTQECS